MTVAEIKISEGRLRRVLANNASPMTADGTNSYLLGQGDCVLIDPGPQDHAHIRAICSALAPSERIVAILITHPHLDHSAAAYALAHITQAPILGFGPAGSARSKAMRTYFPDHSVLAGAEGVDFTFHPDESVADGARLSFGEVELRAIHTPGHMGAHLCFAWGQNLFSGDHVMAWAPSLVSPPEGDMGDYLASLRKLMCEPWSAIFPGHGPYISDPARRLDELLAHRLAREAAILQALGDSEANLSQLCARVYHDISPSLVPAAERNLLAHLLNLAQNEEIALKNWGNLDVQFVAKKKH